MADKYDLHFQTVEEEALQGFKFFTRAFDRTVAVRGINKLMNIWVKMLMTPKGSDPTNLERGTDLPGLIGSNVTSQQDVRDVVLLAISDCNRQLSLIQRKAPSTDADEIFRNAALTNFEVTSVDGIAVWITLSNTKGEEAAVLIPLLTEA